MSTDYLEFLEARANVQYRILEAESMFDWLSRLINDSAVCEKEKSGLLSELTDTYYQILNRLFLEEILINHQ